MAPRRERVRVTRMGSRSESLGWGADPSHGDCAPDWRGNDRMDERYTAITRMGDSDALTRMADSDALTRMRCTARTHTHPPSAPRPQEPEKLGCGPQ